MKHALMLVLLLAPFLVAVAPAHAQEALTREQAEALHATLWEAYADEHAHWQQQVEDRIVIVNDETMRYTLDHHIDTPPTAAGYPLYISLHGGGGGPARMNDQQWANQQRLYRVPGIYVCPRAPRDTWDQFHNAYFFAFMDQLIQQLILYENVDPNRVYIMGYSSGGYGTYQLGPIMADRFAAYATAAAAREGAPLENTRNLPWDYQVGENDTAYNRSAWAAESMAEHRALHEADPQGYFGHLVLHPDRGHQIDDKLSVAWMALHERDPYPNRIVWAQNQDARASSNPVRHHFYWLALDDAYARHEGPADTVTATLEGQTITLETTGYDHMVVRLNDAMLDLDRPVCIVANGTVVHDAPVERSENVMRESLDGYGDPAYVFSAEVRVELTP